jgi:hypothetical protein
LSWAPFERVIDNRRGGTRRLVAATSRGRSGKQTRVSLCDSAAVGASFVRQQLG